jgi:heme oxygenase
VLGSALASSKARTASFMPLVELKYYVNSNMKDAVRAFEEASADPSTEYLDDLVPCIDDSVQVFSAWISASLFKGTHRVLHIGIDASSFGTLGVVTLLEIRLKKSQPLVELKYYVNSNIFFNRISNRVTTPKVPKEDAAPQNKSERLSASSEPQPLVELKYYVNSNMKDAVRAFEEASADPSTEYLHSISVQPMAATFSIESPIE